MLKPVDDRSRPTIFANPSAGDFSFAPSRLNRSAAERTTRCVGGRSPASGE